MKRFFILVAFVATMFSANGQTKKSTGDLFDGLTRKITYDRMVPPYGMEVTFDKTVHIIFPSAVRYIDLGSANIIAGKADGLENVIRIKAAVKGFETETNFSVITEEGSFYSFNVKYAVEPVALNIEMKDFIHDGQAVSHANNSMDIYLTELSGESPGIVGLIMRSIYSSDKRKVKHIGSKRFGVHYMLKGIYTHNGLLYFHTQLKNLSDVPFEVDFIRWKIVDKKVVKRTAMQETVIKPLRAYNLVTQVQGQHLERTVFAMDRFTIPDDKQLIVELFEKNGGRHQLLVIGNDDIIGAEVIDDLSVK